MKKKTILMIGLLVVVSVGGVAAWLLLRGGESPSRDELALDVCHAEASKSLKAPATAVWPTVDSQGVIVREYKEGKATLLVSTYVDAENSFGAKIRTGITCYMRQDSGEWRVLRAEVGQ